MQQVKDVSGQVLDPANLHSIRSPFPTSILIEPFYSLLDQANMALGCLNGLNTLYSNLPLAYMFVRKEAILSSRIQGMEVSIHDVLLSENHNDAVIDQQQSITHIRNYIAAIEYGLKQVNAKYQIDSYLIQKICMVLMIGTSSNIDREAIFSPELLRLCKETQDFLGDEVKLPILIKIALVLAQFEISNALNDRRFGRLIVILLLVTNSKFKIPFVYLSLYFKMHSEQYYSCLQLAQKTGNWGQWLHFFLKGVLETAEHAFESAQKIYHLVATDKQKIEKMGKPAASALIVHHYLLHSPVTGAKKIVEHSYLTLPTVNKSIHHLIDLGIIKEVTGQVRNKIYTYKKYLAILSEGTENTE